MPWKEVTVMRQKQRFIEACSTYEGTFRSLCESFGITTKTGHKYKKKFKEKGHAGLEEDSRRPKFSPKKTPDATVMLIVEARHLHQAWAGDKIRTYLANKGHTVLPTEKTIDRILKRHGLVTIEESEKHKPWIRFEHEAPNDLWQMDFKGHIQAGENRCYPLTLLDDHSRYSLLIKACPNQQATTVKEALINVFQENGLPLKMTMDNGSPWGYSGNQEHTTFSAWLIRLGIVVMHSRPMHPQTQGKLERFHRTLKLELLKRFNFEDLDDAQSGFDWWRKIYNEVRPHAAIGNKTPNFRYRQSSRPYSNVLPAIEYSHDMIVRKVQCGGEIFLNGKEYRVGRAFHGYPVGLKESEEDGIYEVYFCHQRVVKIDLRYPL